MDKKLNPDFYFKDDRGKLIQLVHEGVEQINVLVSNKGVHRGGHYHTKSIESFFVISGSVEVTIHDKEGNGVDTHTFRPDDYFCIEPGEAHSMYFPEDCTMVVMYDKWIEATGEKDIHPAEGC